MRAITSRGSNGVFRSGGTRPSRSSSSWTGGATLGGRWRAELAPVEAGDDAAAEADRVVLVGGEVVGEPGDSGVHLGAAERLVVGLLARRHLQQRRPGEEHLGPLLDHHDVVGHAGQVGAARGGVAEHEGDRRDAVRRRPGEVAERPPAGDEDVLLGRQVGAAGLDEVDRRQPVLEGDVGRTERLAQRVRVARPAFHRRVARADQALDAADDADAGDDAGADGVRRAVGGQRAELEERRVLVERAARCARGRAACRAGGAARCTSARRRRAPWRARRRPRRAWPASPRDWRRTRPTAVSRRRLQHRHRALPIWRRPPHALVAVR